MFGLLTFPFGLVSVVGIVFSEPHVPGFSYKQVKLYFLSTSLIPTKMRFMNSCYIIYR